jgi:hypothetical protein
VVRMARGEYGVSPYLNAGRTHSLEKAKDAAEAGFDEIILSICRPREQPDDPRLRGHA